MKSNQIEVGMLVLRGALMMLVIEIGRDYHDGFALCQELGENPKEFWIDKCLLQPL